MLKILQASLQQYVNHELPNVQAGFRKGRETRDQIANIRWIMEKVREFQKNIYFCFIDYAKAFDCVDHNKLWKILKEMGIPDHLICLFRNLYEGQKATVRTGHETTDWFQIGKGVCQGCILSPCLFGAAGFRKGKGIRDQIVKIHSIIEKAKEFQKNISFCFVDYTKAFDCVDHDKLWKNLRDGNTRPPYLPPKKPVCRPRSNSYKGTWNNGLVPNQERSMSRLYNVTLLI